MDAKYCYKSDCEAVLIIVENETVECFEGHTQPEDTYEFVSAG